MVSATLIPNSPSRSGPGESEYEFEAEAELVAKSPTAALVE